MSDRAVYRRRWLMGLMVIFSIVIGAVPTFAYTSSVVLQEFTISFNGVTYDALADESTWSYTIAGPGGDPGPTVKDVSNWSLELCLPQHVVTGASHPYETGFNLNSGLEEIVIKFDVPVKKDDSVDFSFKLKGRWLIDHQTSVGIKAGPTRYHGYIDGPSCESCHVNYDIRSRHDWRFMKPGTYASIATSLYLQGNTPVTLRFEDFADAQYLADSSAPPVLLDYSYGQTLEEAELNGWIPAADFNNLEFDIGGEMVQAGILFTIWNRARVREVNLSSEYEAPGRVVIIARCQ